MTGTKGHPDELRAADRQPHPRPPATPAAGGGDVCELRLAVNGRRRDRATGEWQQDPNYFDVAAYGGPSAVCGEFLAKGTRVAVTGRLEHRECEREHVRRSAVEVIASDVGFPSPSPETATAEEPAAV